MDEQRAVPYGHNSTSVLTMQGAGSNPLPALETIAYSLCGTRNPIPAFPSRLRNGPERLAHHRMGRRRVSDPPLQGAAMVGPFGYVKCGPGQILQRVTYVPGLYPITAFSSRLGKGPESFAHHGIVDCAKVSRLGKECIDRIRGSGVRRHPSEGRRPFREL